MNYIKTSDFTQTKVHLNLRWILESLKDKNEEVENKSGVYTKLFLTILKTFSHIKNIKPDKSVIVVALLFFALVDQ